MQNCFLILHCMKEKRGKGLGLYQLVAWSLSLKSKKGFLFLHPYLIFAWTYRNYVLRCLPFPASEYTSKE